MTSRLALVFHLSSMFLVACGTSSEGGSAEPSGSGGSPSSGAGGAAPGAAGAATTGSGGTVADGGGGSAVAGRGGSVTAGGGASTGGASVDPGAGGGGAAGASPVGDASTEGGVPEDATIVPHPSWDCGMPNGIPAPARGTLVFDAQLQLGQVYDLGRTQFGDRKLVEIAGGTVTGPKIKAKFLAGGLDWQLTLPNGAVEDEQVTVLKADSGESIYFRNCGTSPGAGTPVRVVPDFEAATSGAFAWLNTGTFVGTRTFDAASKTLTLSVYQVGKDLPAAPTVNVVEPAGLPDQKWDCATPSGTRTTVVYTESVGIGGGSIAVGASKRGTRNIIPITGGTTTGKIAGTVLSGGGDYQLIGASFVLDARYTLHTSDGELVIVRNCGPVGSLVPVFETRSNGPYAWLNQGRYLSSDPGISPGAVNLTIYDTK